MQDWYVINNVELVDTPALIIYKKRVQQNIDAAIGMVGDVTRLRPHIKTHKNVETAAMMLEAGIQKFKCATIAEAEMLAIAGATDILMAYQPVGPKIQRWFSLVSKYPGSKFSCLIDNQQVAQALASTALANNTTANVFIDVNVGMNRTGIIPPYALDLFKFCTAQPGLYVQGLHAYDGHIRHLDLTERARASDSCFEMVEGLSAQLYADGYEVQSIIAGGSPTFPIHAKRAGVECSPGTFVYWDKTYIDGCPEQPFVPAALVLGRVISNPASGIYCVDIGHKAIASENTIDKRVHFLNAPDLQPISHSEEHLVVQTTETDTLQTGDILYGLPYHICPTVALHSSAAIVTGGDVTDEWNIVARNRKITV